MTFTKFKAMLAKDEKLRNTLEVKSIEETTPDSAMVVRLDPDMVVTEDDVKKINQAILRAINIYPNLDSGTKSNLIRQFQRLNPVLRIKHKKKILPDDAEFNEIRGKVIYFIMKDANIGKSLNYPEAYKIFLRIKRAVNFYQFSPLNNRKEPVTAEEAIGMAVDELNLKPKLSQELKNYLATIDPWIRFERDSVGQIDPIKVIVETFHSAFLADREFYPSESDAIRIDMIYKLVKAAKKRVNEFKGYYFTSDESKSVPGSDEAMVAKNKGPIIFDLKSQILRDDLVKFNEYDQMGFFLFMLETLMKHRVATTDRDAIKQLLDEAYDDLNFSVNIFKKGDAEAVQNPSVDLPAIPEYRTIVQMASYYLFGVVLDEDDFIKELIAGKSPMFDAMKEAWSIKIEIDQVVKPKATFGDILKKWHGITRNWNATSGSLVPESIHEINSDQNFDLLSRALNIAMGRMPTTDAAMMAENKGPISVFDKGGIDLNPNAMNMRVQREGKGVAMPKMLSPKKFADVEGFRPVIINVVPIINLPQLMGQNTKPKDSPAPKAAFYAPFEESREVVMMGKL